MNRKTFIKKAAGTLLIGIPAISLLGCSNDDSANGDPTIDPEQRDCAENGANATAISNNHGHTLTVSKEDIEAGVEKTYSIQGGSGHNHDITLTAENFTTLKSAKTIQVESSRGNSHRHDVTVSCA
ncbi:hypothetical protein [Maribacter sp. 2304DJ31-5]|uniref:hypothetical protein n=1 Tax=Maribacter sp. 2304DJ31-5 TaxID=3386273 RepID=UPI0039BC58B3